MSTWMYVPVALHTIGFISTLALSSTQDYEEAVYCQVGLTIAAGCSWLTGYLA